MRKSFEEEQDGKQKRERLARWERTDVEEVRD